MKINWKELAQSPGYLSLKAAYVRDVHKAGMELARGRRPMRNKQEFLKLFRFVIDMAQHYAIRTDSTVADVLNDWESKRGGYWWLNHYGSSHQPKLPSGKPRNVCLGGERRYFMGDRAGWDKNARYKRFKEYQQRSAKIARENSGKKARWTPEQKARAARMRKYQSL